jgi:hypothetical protein
LPSVSCTPRSNSAADPRGHDAVDSPDTTYLVFGADDPSITDDTDILSLLWNWWVGGFTAQGEAAGDQSGYAVAGLGDINDDGVPDIGVGAPYADFNGTSAGRAYVVFGDPALGGYWARPGDGCRCARRDQGGSRLSCPCGGGLGGARL